MILQIEDSRCQDGMAELRGQKGPGNGLKRGTKKPEMRWTKYTERGRLVERLIKMKDWTGGWIRKNTAKNQLETMKTDDQNV